jgi:O-antigen/teichoic acid export membrane protein
LAARFAFTAERVAAVGVEATVVTLGQAGAVGAALVLTKVLTSTLGEEQYGQYALVMTGPMLLQQFVFGPASQAGLRFYPEHAARGTLPELLRVIFGWLRRVSLLAAAIAIVIAVGLAMMGLWGLAALTLLALVIGLAQNYQALFASFQAAARQRGVVAVHQVLDPAARAVGAFLTMRWLGVGAVTGTTGVMLGAIAVMLSQRQQFLFSHSAEPAAPAKQSMLETANAMWSYGSSFALWGLFTWAQQASDRWSLNAFADAESVGVYVAAYQLASVPTLLAGTALSQFVFPIVFNRAGDGTAPAALRSAARAVHIVTALFAVWLAVAVALCWLIGSQLLLLMTSERFLGGAPLLVPLTFGLGLAQLAQLLSLIPLSSKRLDTYRWVKISQSVVGVGLNIIGAAVAGVEGVVLALIVSAGIYLLAVFVVNRQILKANLDGHPAI